MTVGGLIVYLFAMFAGLAFLLFFIDAFVATYIHFRGGAKGENKRVRTNIRRFPKGH